MTDRDTSPEAIEDQVRRTREDLTRDLDALQGEMQRMEDAWADRWRRLRDGARRRLADMGGRAREELRHDGRRFVEVARPCAEAAAKPALGFVGTVAAVWAGYALLSRVVQRRSEDAEEDRDDRSRARASGRGRARR